MKLKPFVKWAGGKRQLLPEILERIPKDISLYIEPFVGGGAVFLELLSSRKDIQKLIINDVNHELIMTYQAIKDDVDSVIGYLKHMPHSEDMFYAMRSHTCDGMTKAGIAARFIYLNKTCFNGLYRVNKKGQFNVPFGKYKNPKICDEELLIELHKAFTSVDMLFFSLEFEEVFKFWCMDQLVNNVEAFEFSKYKYGTFVYFDPPYYPIKPTSFKAYDKGPMGKKGHIALVDLMVTLRNNGIKALLSNSDTEFTDAICSERDLKIERVYARRSINSDGSNRGKVSELLVRNY